MQAFCYPACWLYEPGNPRNILANIVKSKCYTTLPIEWLGVILISEHMISKEPRVIRTILCVSW